MPDKELKRLSRAELIDIIYELQKINEEEKLQNQKLKEKLEEIEIQVLEIKLLVKQLPNYHQFISDLSKNLTKCTENKK